jgi:acetyl-CoA acetyltransferase
MRARARIVGAAESAYVRHPPDGLTTERVLANVSRAAVADAGLSAPDIDGFGVASFSLAPDRAIDLAAKLGLRVRWLMDGGTGGASAIDMLQHARAAIETGDAQRILLASGDVMRLEDFRNLTNAYNVARRDHIAPIPHGGAPSLFALVTQRHMKEHDLSREEYGGIVTRQREWAALNPNAAYRDPLSLDDYLAAPMVAPPLSIYDCVPVVAGANAVLVASEGDGVSITAIGVNHNVDAQEGDGLRTGLADISENLWRAAGKRPEQMDLVSVYDDFPVMVFVQLADLGLGEPREVLSAIREGRLRVNTSGGQLSAGQAGSAGGMHGLVEVVQQLRGLAGERQVVGARFGAVTGYGMLAYRYGAAANMAVLASE